MDLKELALVDPNRHWYYQSKLAALERALRRYAPDALRFVDVGAGSGFFSCELARFDSGAEVLCVDPNYPSERTEKDGALRFVRSADSANADVYLFIDVLEHVADDVGLLRLYTGSSAPGTMVFITVPAFMSMWSAHDTYLEHRRRYTLNELAGVVESAGLQVVERRYLFGAILPIAWAKRLLHREGPDGSDLAPVAAPLNWLLTTILTAEHRLGRNRTAGLSAFIIARVPQDAG